MSVWTFITRKEFCIVVPLTFSCFCQCHQHLTFPKSRHCSHVCVHLCSPLYQHEHHLCVTPLHLDGSNVLVRCSAAGLGQLHRSVLTQKMLQEIEAVDLTREFCSFLRSGLWYMWGGLGQSQLFHHSQVLHHLHPHLLLFHPCHDHAFFLHFHNQNCEKCKCYVGWWLPHRPPKEGGERCYKGGFLMF